MDALNEDERRRGRPLPWVRYAASAGVAVGTAPMTSIGDSAQMLGQRLQHLHALPIAEMQAYSGVLAKPLDLDHLTRLLQTLAADRPQNH